MIQTNTKLNVIDNSGAKIVSCISTGYAFNKKHAVLGDMIVVSIKKLRSKRKITSKILKGEICNALIVRTVFNKFNSYGERYNFIENSVVLFNRKNKFLFTRVFGALPRFIRYTKFMKLVSLSSGILK